MFQGIIIRNDPAFRLRPAAVPGYHKFSHGSYDAFVATTALEHISQEARQSAPNETIGHIVGRPFRDAKGPYAIITEAITATSARRGPVTVETSLDDERWLLDTLLAKHPTCEKLGWFHSHPFPMPNYSDTDAENQQFWGEPYHLGLLATLEHKSDTVSIHAFRGPESERLQPPYTTAGGGANGSSISAAVFRPLFKPAPAGHVKRRPEHSSRSLRRWSSLATLSIVAGIIWPIVYLIGTWMIVHAVQDSSAHSARAE